MGKSTKKKNKKITAPKANIQELSISRDGGQIALRGYSYQFLYSCYLILSSSNPSNFFQLEGIEDIDCIMQKNGSNDITHIQLKYSVNKQDASFLTDVLKNFLEAYLLDQNRFFKLVYDFPVAKGHLSKIFASKLDEKSRTHWAGVISNIKKNNPSWNWSVYDFDKFISHLSFEKIEKSILATEIEKTLIRIYEINTDNVSLFANSIKILCFEKMEQRAYVTKAELDSKIQSVKIDISKGPQNPAHSWIRKLDYSKPSIDEGCSFYEGKKATPADIVSGFPIKRPSLEKDVINSICENMVTVIKASSGQGKTTLALRAAYILQNEYIPYQLLWCDEIKEIGNIVQYFKARIQLGEKILILIDNLDNHLSKWNYLVQLLQSELHCHYKLLITSREMDWYNYSGDLSNIQSLKVIKPVLEEKEAIEIFNLFREAKQLHPSITSWQRAWNKIAERQLLIEYARLIKSCREADIPFPSSGYWARKNFGKDVSAEVIPLSGDGSLLVNLWTNDSFVKSIKRTKVEERKNVQEELSVTQNKSRLEKKSVEKETVTAHERSGMLEFLDEEERRKVLSVACSLEISENTRLHRALVQYKKQISEYNAELKNVQNQRYYNKSKNEPEFFKEVSKEGTKRLMAILDALFKAVEKLGG